MVSSLYSMDQVAPCDAPKPSRTRSGRSGSRYVPVYTPASATSDAATSPVALIHIAARVGALAGPSEVLVTDAVKTFLDGSDFAFRTKMTTRLKGLPGTWELHAVR